MTASFSGCRYSTSLFSLCARLISSGSSVWSGAISVLFKDSAVINSSLLSDEYESDTDSVESVSGT